MITGTVTGTGTGTGTSMYTDTDISDTQFSIVENTNQQIILQNILMMNQYKILSMIAQLFDTELNGIFQTPTLSNSDIEFIKQKISNGKFIDWSNFLFLINSRSTFKYKTYTHNTLSWIIETRSRNLLLFLLALEPKIIDWSITNPHTKTNVLGMIFICFANDDVLLSHVLNTISSHYDFFTPYLRTENRFRRTPVDYIIAQCSEQIVLLSVRMRLIGTDCYEDLMVISCMYDWIDLFKELVMEYGRDRDRVHGHDHAHDHGHGINGQHDLIRKCVEESFYYLSYDCAVESLKYVGTDFLYGNLFSYCVGHEWVNSVNDSKTIIKFLKLFSDRQVWCSIHLLKYIIKTYESDVIKYVLYDMIDCDELKLLGIWDVGNMNMHLGMKMMSNEMCYINSFWFLTTCEYVKAEFTDCQYYLTGQRMAPMIYDE